MSNHLGKKKRTIHGRYSFFFPFLVTIGQHAVLGLPKGDTVSGRGIPQPASYSHPVKSITDPTPNELIDITHLKRAAKRWAAGDCWVYEVAGMVCYSSRTNFGRNFSNS